MTDQRADSTTAHDIARVYWATFAGAPRYSIWDRARNHWAPIHGDPTREQIVDALTRDGPPLAPFFLDNDSMTHVLAIDADGDDGWDVVMAVASYLRGCGIAGYGERSRRGGHLWIVVDRVLPAIVGRFAILAAIEGAGSDPGDSKIELRPSSDRRVSPFGGDSLRGPWMAHPATGQRAGLLDMVTGEPLADGVGAALVALELADHRAIGALAEHYKPPARGLPEPRRGRIEPGSVSAVLRQRFGTHDTRNRPIEAGKSIVCPFHEDTNPSMKIAEDDRRAWCHSPRCVAHENGRGITAWQAARIGIAA
jgi:hypothetical protein